MQTSINFQKERTEIEKRLGKVEKIVQECFNTYPNFREIKALNYLVRYIWKNYEDLPVQSITRTARRLRAEYKKYDTEDNQNDRANLETAYHDYFR